MILSPEKVTLYACIPMLISLLGGLIAKFYKPHDKATSFLQHLVAGIVIGAVSVELIPKIVGQGNNFTIFSGFLLGVISMFALEKFSERLEEKDTTLPIGLIFGAALDLLIDGMLIGIAFIAGVSSGVVIAVSLSLCGFFLTLSVSATLSERKSKGVLNTLAIIFISSMIPIGAFIGSAIVSQLPNEILIETLAFGIAALLYLGVEELLGQAHKKEETPWITSAFFIGFLVILLFRV